MSEESWDEVMQARDIDIAVDCFYNTIYTIFDKCIPKKKRVNKPARRYPVWFSADLIKDVKEKSRLHCAWKQSRCPNIYTDFSLLRSKIKKKITLAYNDHIKHIQVKLNRDPNAFWQHVQSLKTKAGFEQRVKYSEKEYVGAEAAEAFANFFSSVFLPEPPVLDYTKQQRDFQVSSANFVNIDNFTISDIEIGIDNLKSKSAVGPDNIPAYILKGSRDFIISPVFHIFTMVLSNGYYPERWKITRVQPIPKTNDHSRVENYRPIAILSSLPKLFESILHKYITRQIQPYLCDSQHGFRLNRSVNSNLLTTVDIISQHLDRNTQVDVVYFDFVKAFDRVDNDVLLDKLNNIGFSPKLLKFFASYLRDRQQYVQYGCFISPPFHTRSGVSQGSILGPLLFGIMINDLETVITKSKCLLYADDLKLICGIKDITDTVSLQNDIHSIARWSRDNKLFFNIAKCCVMSYSRARNPYQAQYHLGSDMITRVQSVRDLGVIFDPKLNFHEHMRSLAADSYRRLGFVIRNMRDFDNPTAIKMVYMAIVRSKIESASVVWNPHEYSYSLLLEKVQKIFLRFLYGKIYGYYPYLYPTKFLLGMLKFNSLEVRRNYLLLSIVCNIMRGSSDCPELVSSVVRLSIPVVSTHQLRPRRHPTLAVPAARTVSHANSPICRALTMLNALLISMPECDLFAWSWSNVRRECLRFCEMKDL